MIIPTDGGLRPWDAKWQPMTDWLRANHFEPTNVPVDALIEIRDETCIGAEYYVRDPEGRVRIIPGSDYEALRRTEWRPMIVPPPEILLPR